MTTRGIRETLSLYFEEEKGRKAFCIEKAHSICKYPIAEKDAGTLRAEWGISHSQEPYLLFSWTPHGF